MEFSKKYNEYNNLGLQLFSSGKNEKNITKIESAIQYFEKAIASAEIEGISDFTIAENNLKLAKNELDKLNW
jgi:hypothetical protein